jgi:6-phospho-3-hexuloisomerase
MSFRTLLGAVLEELRGTLSQAEEGRIAALLDRITAARRLFLAGSGRSGFMMRAFAVRLVHLGFCTYVAGESVTPNLEAADLLILGSGSGETAGLRAMAEKARRLRAPIALITASPQSAIGRAADVVVTLPAPTPKARAAQTACSVQPMGSLFEQSLLLFLDLVVLLLMERRGIGAEAMFARHANLE